MQCRNCGTEIAEKAIVCFRCGTATTEARFKPSPPARRRLSPLSLVMSLVALALLFYAIYVSQSAAQGSSRGLGWAAVVIALVILVLRAVARRR